MTEAEAQQLLLERVEANARKEMARTIRSVEAG